jgi:hypothetical protein
MLKLENWQKTAIHHNKTLQKIGQNMEKMTTFRTKSTAKSLSMTDELDRRRKFFLPGCRRGGRRQEGPGSAIDGMVRHRRREGAHWLTNGRW